MATSQPAPGYGKFTAFFAEAGISYDDHEDHDPIIAQSAMMATMATARAREGESKRVRMNRPRPISIWME
jgi:hypothetical protein